MLKKRLTRNKPDHSRRHDQLWDPLVRRGLVLNRDAPPNVWVVVLYNFGHSLGPLGQHLKCVVFRQRHAADNVVDIFGWDFFMKQIAHGKIPTEYIYDIIGR